MKTIVISTHNQDKLREIRAMTGPSCRLVSKQDLGLGDIDFEETGDSLEANALIKAQGLAQAMQERGMAIEDCWIVADDTGLFVEGLDGAPGVYSARYAGEEATYQDNVDKLLKNMEGVANRKAYFATVIAVLHGPEPAFYEGRLEGEILDQARGGRGFGYDPVFYLPDLGKTLAELSAEEKNQISHRHRAYAKFLESLDA